MQMNSLFGKVALITGSARRIGASIAESLHAKGMNIVLHYNASEDDAIQLCEKLNKTRHSSAAVVQGDLQEPGIVKEIVERAHNNWQRLDVLVNNASRFYRTEFDKVTEYAWNDLLNSNLKGPFFLAQSSAPYLRQTNGCIINIADIHGEKPLRDYSVYCLSKAGLLMLTKVLAKELGPQVRVNAVSPGAIIWPEGKNQLSDEQKEKIIDRIALSRPGSPEDIAKAVVFLVGEAEYITGQTINVDGGRYL